MSDAGSASRERGTTTRLSLNTVDELIYHLDQHGDPWTVHCEVSLPRHLDEKRLGAAARAACRVHPILRGSLRRSWGGFRYRWAIAADAPHVGIGVHEAADDEAVARVRGSVLSEPIDLGHAPPFTVTVIRHPGGDQVVVSLHHAAGDGMSAYRVMSSLARAYSGQEEQAEEEGLAPARRLRAAAGARSWTDVRVRAAGLVALVDDHRRQGPPARVARNAEGEALSGYGFVTFAHDAAATRDLVDRTGQGVTVNDRLLASLGRAIRRFNDERGRPRRRITAMMPVNLRPAEARERYVSNIVAFAPVDLTDAADAPGGLDGAQAVLAEQTRRLKSERRYGTMIDLLAIDRVVPSALSRWVLDRGHRVVRSKLDTTVMSNLGRVDDAPAFGEAGAAHALWFSPPAGMPLGVAVGVATIDGRLHCTVRYCRTQFDEAGAAAFVSTWREVLADRSP